MSSSISTDRPVHDVFVSYAHRDNQDVPNGWVTTLVSELKTALALALGRDADVWMDSKLVENENFTEALLTTIRSSRTLLMIMSEAYQGSFWTKREVGNFLVESEATKNKSNVFIIEIQSLSFEYSTWHPRLRDLTAFRFWTKKPGETTSFRLGREDREFFDRVNAVGNAIAAYFKKDGSREQAPEPKFTVVLAEVTDDLRKKREGLAATLQQHLAEVLPATGYPEDTEVAFVDALRHDLKRATLFVQLLGPLEGEGAPDTGTAFVEVQAIEAEREAQARGLRILRWRPPGLDPGEGEAPWVQELLRAQDVRACSIEEFKQDVINALRPPQPPPPPRIENPLSVYINADVADREVADVIGDALSKAGVDTMMSPLPAPGQTPEEIRRAELEILNASDGAIIVYGHAPDTWVVSQFQVNRKVLAQKRSGVWGALLYAPPPGKRAPVKSPSLLILEYRDGVDPTQVAALVDALRLLGNVGHAP